MAPSLVDFEILANEVYRGLPKKFRAAVGASSEQKRHMIAIKMAAQVHLMAPSTISLSPVHRVFHEVGSAEVVSFGAHFLERRMRLKVNEEKSGIRQDVLGVLPVLLDRRALPVLQLGGLDPVVGRLFDGNRPRHRCVRASADVDTNLLGVGVLLLPERLHVAVAILAVVEMQYRTHMETT